MNLKSLTNFLEKSTIPRVQNRIGFLELIKKEKNETINSQVYAYFLSCNVSEIKTTFLGSLLELIQEKSGKRLSIYAPFVYTEDYTSNKKRIDIVIEDYHNQSAIIIENKINHMIDNPFLDYWNHYNKYDEVNRIGILLTKKVEVVPKEVDEFFINITHNEWIDKIKKKLDVDVLDVRNRIYLQDFFNTIENFKKENRMNESASFYFNNASKVLEAINTRLEAEKFLNEQFDYVADSLGLSSRGKHFEWRSFYPKKLEIDIYLTVITERLMLGDDKVMIILELQGDNINKADNLDKELANNPQFIDKKKGKKEGKQYFHYLVKEYKFTTLEIANLGETIISKIQSDFADIFIKVIKISYPKYDIGSLKEKLLNNE